MFQNTKNILYDTFNTLFYETFTETGMFHLCFTGISSKSLKLFTPKINAIHRETGMFQEMFHRNQPLNMP